MRRFPKVPAGPGWCRQRSPWLPPPGLGSRHLCCGSALHPPTWALGRHCSGDMAHPGSEASTLEFSSAFFGCFRFMQRYQPTNTRNKGEMWNCGGFRMLPQRITYFPLFCGLAGTLSHFTTKKCGPPPHGGCHLNPDKLWHLLLLFLDEYNRRNSWCMCKKYTSCDFKRTISSSGLYGRKVLLLQARLDTFHWGLVDLGDTQCLPLCWALCLLSKF